MDQVGAGAVDERGDRGLVEQERLGLLEKGEAPHRIGGGGGLVEERVVGLVAPAGPVLAVAGAEDFKEGGGVGEVGGPTEEAEGMGEVLLVLKQGFLFEGLDCYADAELALPHGLDGFHHAGLIFIVEHLHGDGGEIFPAGKAGLGEEAAGFGRIQRDVRARDVGAAVGRNHHGGGEKGAVEDFLGKSFAIHREREGAAHAWIGEGDFGDVEVEVGDVQEWIDAEGRGGLGAVSGEL